MGLFAKTVLGKVLRNTRKIDSDKALFKTFENNQNQAQILDEIFEYQIYEMGVDGDGVPLGQYRPSTIQRKLTEDAASGYDTRVDHITLKRTGALYASRKVINNGKDIEISADLKKGDTDFNELYPNLMKPGPESKKVIVELILPEVRDEIKGQIFTGL